MQKSRLFYKIICFILLSIPMVAQEMQSDKTISQNISSSKEHTFLAANINAAGLAQTLAGKGPFTVFAPVDKAFEKSSAINIEKSEKIVDKSNLKGLITYHIVAGKMDSKAIGAAIKSGGGKASMTTLEGGKLIASLDGSKVILTDEKGNRITVTDADVYSSNGVIHVTDKVFVRR